MSIFKRQKTMKFTSNMIIMPRRPNWTSEELDSLKYAVGIHQNVLSSSNIKNGFGSQNMTRKRMAWAQISRCVNIVSKYARSATECRRKWTYFQSALKHHGPPKGCGSSSVGVDLTSDTQSIQNDIACNQSLMESDTNWSHINDVDSTNDTDVVVINKLMPSVIKTEFEETTETPSVSQQNVSNTPTVNCTESSDLFDKTVISSITNISEALRNDRMLLEKERADIERLRVTVEMRRLKNEQLRLLVEQERLETERLRLLEERVRIDLEKKRLESDAAFRKH